MAFGQTWHGLPQHLLVPAMRVLQDLQWVEELQQHHRNGQVPLWTPQIDQDCNNQFRFNQQRITKTSIPGSPWRAAKNKSKPDKSAHNLSHSARHEKHIQHACTRQQSSILQVSTCESFENSHNTKVTDINHTESYPCQFHQLDAKQQRLRFFPFEHFQSPNSMMPSPGHAWKQPQELIYIYIYIWISQAEGIKQSDLELQCRVTTRNFAWTQPKSCKEHFSSLNIFFVQSTLTLGLYCRTSGNI